MLRYKIKQKCLNVFCFLMLFGDFPLKMLKKKLWYNPKVFDITRYNNNVYLTAFIKRLISSVFWPDKYTWQDFEFLSCQAIESLNIEWCGVACVTPVHACSASVVKRHNWSSSFIMLVREQFPRVLPI